MTTNITLPRAVVAQALEAVEDLLGYRADIDEAITALRAASYVGGAGLAGM